MNTTIKERPILFSAPMVRAILDGRKTQTRRVVKRGQVFRFCPGGDLSREERSRMNASAFEWESKNPAHPTMDELLAICPYGAPGDRLWVRETWQDIGCEDRTEYIYLASVEDGYHPPTWRPSIHMPRAACRIVLEVVSVRVERLNEITEADAIAEGSQCAGVPAATTNAGAFAKLWEAINGKGSWAINPWVWVVEFKSGGGGA